MRFSHLNVVAHSLYSSLLIITLKQEAHIQILPVMNPGNRTVKHKIGGEDTKTSGAQQHSGYPSVLIFRSEKGTL
jgi:hypothetical protein